MRTIEAEKERHGRSRAEMITATLSGAWRRPPFSPLAISEIQLEQVTPLLYESAAGGLGWWRVRASKLCHTASAEVLREAYHLNSVQATMHEEKIKKIFRLLDEAGIEVILAKGWAAATLYPSLPLRPYHDIDICVRPADFKAARELLMRPDMEDCWVDLHDRFSELNDRPITDVFSRSRLVNLGGEQIRILGAEDHLALLAIHFLKHGAWRPLWLCDIGVAIESLPADFNWDVCLGNDQTRAKWIICVIGLANRLLGAHIDSLPVAVEAKKLPAWLLENVLAQWENPLPRAQPPFSHPIPISAYFRRPRGMWKGLAQRWPNPIIATVSVNGKFNDFPRLPYQVGNCILRAAHFLFARPRNGC